MKTSDTPTTRGNASSEASRDATSPASVPQRSALEMLKDEYESSNAPAYLAQVAAACQREGRSEQEAAAFILAESPYELEPDAVKAIVHDAFNGIGLPTEDELAAQQLARQQREFFNRRYEFRRNEVKGVTEYRERKKLKTSFRPVDKSVMHSIALDAHEEGIDMWDRDVVRFTDSLRVRPYSPFDDYIYSLPKWDGKERIDKLFARVPSADERWKHYAHRWFVGMVAGWLQMGTRQHGNELMPLLIGGQNTGKSTFCRLLLPRELEDYYTDDVTLDSRAEVQRLLGRFGLLNLDELDRIPDSRVPMLKNLLQLPRTTQRRAYTTQIEHRPRYASLIGTTNSTAILSDLTGSRRFLCVEIPDDAHIDVTTSINHRQLYAQAYAELRQGFRYWLTKEEEEEIALVNARYHQLPPLAEDIAAVFMAAQPDDPEARWLTAKEIALAACPQKAQRLSNKAYKEIRTIMENFIKSPSEKTRKGMTYCVKEAKE